jgi:hypothetical protein
LRADQRKYKGEQTDLISANSLPDGCVSAFRRGWIRRYADIGAVQLIEAFEMIMTAAAVWFVCQSAIEAFR